MSGPKSRYKESPGIIQLGEYRTYQNLQRTGPYTVTNHTVSQQGILETLAYSEGHRGPPYRSGGPFSVYRYGSTIYPSSSSTISNLNNTYIGSFAIGGGFSGSNPTDNTGKMVAAGTTAWGRFAPTKEEAGFGQFLGELHELPRMYSQVAMARSFTDKMRGAGSDYLNVQFGWKPFVKDLRDTLHTMQHIEERLAQLERDNGQRVRRGGTVSSTSSSTSTRIVGQSNGVSPTPPLATQFFSRLSEWTRETRTYNESKYWFSGRYRYYIPNIKTRVGRARLILRQIGVDATPNLLWQLMPWSWMLDWFYSYGDIIRNVTLQHQYNLTTDYAYVMGHERTITEQSQMIWDRTGKQHISGRTSISEIKARGAASPYGFGVKSGDLNSYQVSILTALGISRKW